MKKKIWVWRALVLSLTVAAIAIIYEHFQKVPKGESVLALPSVQ